MDTLTDLLHELETTGDDEATVEIAAEAMAAGGTPREGLTRLLDHDLPAVRRAATLALGRRSDHKVRTLLEARLDDDSAQVRSAACVALAELGDTRSALGVTQRLEDRMPLVRAAAADAQRAFASAEAVEALDELLRREASLAPRRAAVDALIDLLHGPTRQAALLALTLHVPREDDLELRRRAVAALIETLEPTTHQDADDAWGALLGLFRQVPRSGWLTLADAMEAQPDLPPLLVRLVTQLRHLPADFDVLERFGSNLSRRVQRGELPQAFGREQELQQVLDRLQRPGPKAVVLVGPSGVGKTAIVHAIAQRLGEASVLVPTQILEATTGEILSGTRYLGEWQGRIKELTDALRAPRRVIWYVPDVNRLVEAGTTEHSQESFATMLAPALERGELVILGECTPEAFRRGLDRFPGFRKLFWRLSVDAPDPGQSGQVLAAVADRLTEELAGRGVELSFSLDAQARTQDLADDYFPSQARPGNAVRLLRESVEASVQRAHGRHRGPATADPLSETHTTRVEVSAGDVLESLSRLSGVPQHLLDDTVRLDLNKVSAFFSERVLGQEEAVETVVDLISLIKAGVTDPSRPQGVLFFAGPTGVGKTEMAKAIAEYIFGSAERLVRVDLGEFREAHSIRRLVGDPHAPDPAARSGLLTAAVRERPFSVVLLDEVEKAHHNVFDLLLPLLDEGRLVDELGRVTDFRRCIILMTSNLGADLREGIDLGFGPGAEERQAMTDKVRRVMEKTFRPEFLNRLRSTVVFQPLTLEVMRRLTRREVRRVLSRKGITRREVVVELDDAVIGVLLEQGFSHHYGARHLKRRVEDLLLKPLARAIHQVDPQYEALIRLRVARDGRILSSVVVQRSEEEELEVAPPRPTRRVRDATGRLIDLDALEGRILDMTEAVESIATVLEDQELRQRKSVLLRQANQPSFWAQPAKARAVMSEIAALEKTLEKPGHLDGALEAAERQLTRARLNQGKPAQVLRLMETLDALAHEIEITTYAVHCTAAEDRGDAYLLLRRVGDVEFPEDTIAHLGRMYRRYLRGKGFAVVTVYEAVSRDGRVREAALRVEGLCALGLLAGEAGLHQWIARDKEDRRNRTSTFARVTVLPPPERELRADEVSVERRRVREKEGVLLKKHHQHLVLTHHASQLAIDGSVDSHERAEEGALEFLAARVGRPGGGGELGVVRRYVISHQSLVRDLATNTKLHLDAVLEGRLDEFILPRVVGEA
jgi:ATP-dependent Clp protease ATP-binding subunit ClpC